MNNIKFQTRQPFIQKANENKKRYREHWLEYEKGMRIAKKPSGIDILVIAPPAPALSSFDYFCMAKRYS
jgi:hypothetical protein